MKRFLGFSIVILALILGSCLYVRTVVARPATFTREIPIANSANQERLAALGVNDWKNYLVIWEVDAGGGNIDIWGQHMTHWGVRLGQPFPIAATEKPELAARVAYNPQDNEFLVVYEYAYQENDHDIRGQRVDGHKAALIGDALPIGVTTGDERTPDVAYLPATGQYLVLYTLEGDIWARRVARRGRGNGGGDFYGDEFLIAADPASPERDPAVAAATDDGYFLVTYTYAFSPDDDDVMAQRVRGMEDAGEQLLGEKISLAASLEREGRPALAYSPWARAFITLWQISLPFSEDVRGRWIDATDFTSHPFIGETFDIAADALALERSPQVDVDTTSGEVFAAFSYAPAPGEWYRPALARLNGNPHASNHLLAPPRILPERDGHVLTPRIKIAPGRPRFIQGYTIQWGTSADADTDAYIYLTDRWSVILPMIWK